MKKWLLVALNAKYSHTSLSVRSICSYVLKNGYNNISFFEGTINDEYFCLLNSILEKNPDVIGFSCYIWNIELVKKLVSDLKETSPHITVFLGGPEVSYNKSLFKEIPQIDFVIRGEGEIPILKLLKGEDNILGVCKSDNEYHFAEMEEIETENAIGRIAARLNLPCPPCIALAVPGEIIDEKIAGLLKKYGIEKINVVK